MNKIKELNASKSPIAVYDKELDKYENMPLFQKKVDLANEILAKSPPTEVFKQIENHRIKKHFTEGKSIAEIAVLMKMSEADITSRLKELGLLLVENV